MIFGHKFDLDRGKLDMVNCKYGDQAMIYSVCAFSRRRRAQRCAYSFAEISDALVAHSTGYGTYIGAYCLRAMLCPISNGMKRTDL